MIKEIIEILQISNDTFWSIMSSFIVGIIVPVISGVINCVRKMRKRKTIWNVDVKYVNDKFYIWLLMVYLIFSVIIGCIFYSLRNSTIGRIVRFVFVILLCGAVIYYINKSKRVRLVLLRTDVWYKKILINMPLFLLTIAVCSINEAKDSHWIEGVYVISSFGTCICEFLGLFHFHYSYDVYMHAYARIIMKSGYVIENIDVDTVYKRKQWLEYQIGENKGNILLENIEGIEYYGDKKYIVRDFYGNKYSLEDVGIELM